MENQTIDNKNARGAARPSLSPGAQRARQEGYINSRKGKIGSQIGHAVEKVFLDRMKFINDESGDYYRIEHIHDAAHEWIYGVFKKLLVSAKDEAELNGAKKKVEGARVTHSVVNDNGLTEFYGVLTFTCMAMGPDEEDKIDPITKDLPPL
jgi:PTH2 family peptidyl-tRNA hydrolase